MENVTKEKALKLLERENGGIIETIVNPIHKNKKTPSEKYRRKVTQVFDKNKIMKTDATGKFNVYDKIQEFKRETEIYSVLEDYNCTKDEAMQRMNANLQEIQSELNMGLNTTYSDQLQAVNKAAEMFENLPLSVRKKFDYSIENFMKNGKAYIDGLIEEQNKKNQMYEQPLEQIETSVETGDINNA